MANPQNLTTDEAIAHRFGGSKGNPRNPGGWKKEDTARYKLEQMLKLDEKSLERIANDKETPIFERRIAKSLLKETTFKTTEAMINQIYGYPKQEVQQTILEPPKPLSPRKQKKEQ